jgi:hypothetical protein
LRDEEEEEEEASKRKKEGFPTSSFFFRLCKFPRVASAVFHPPPSSLLRPSFSFFLGDQSKQFDVAK